MRVLALATAAFLGPAALADVSFSIRAGDGTFWTNYLGTDGCQYPQIHIGVFAHFTGAAALSGARFNITATESRGLTMFDRALVLSDPGLGRQAPFTLGANAQAAFFTATGWRIDEASDVANNPAVGITCIQSPITPTTDNDVLLYQFTFNPSCSLTGVLIGINISEVSAQVFPTIGAPAVPATIGTLSNASMLFVPAPHSFALLGAAGSLAAVRRRRTMLNR